MRGFDVVGAAPGRGEVYELVTKRLIERLEAGVVPWRRPWISACNLVSRRLYRGVNTLLLGNTRFEAPYWLTFKQALDLGGHVNKGEHGELVVFWKVYDKQRAGGDDCGSDEPGGDEPEVEHRFVLRYYYVFNVAQCELPAGAVPAGAPVQAAAGADEIIAGYLARGGPALEHAGGRACYSPKLDQVRVPGRQAFETGAGYVSTLFHELIHSTGHSTRLSRAEVVRLESGAGGIFGDCDYSREELVAEIGAAMLCGVAGIEPGREFDNSAAYLAGWLEALRDDSKAVVYAAARAQRGADFVLGAAALAPAVAPELEAVAA